MCIRDSRNSLDLLDKDCHEKEKNKNIRKLSEKLWDEFNHLKGIELVLDKKYLNGIVSFNIENIKDKDKFVPEHKLFSKEKSSQFLINIIKNQSPECTGKFIAWDSSEIPW